MLGNWVRFSTTKLFDAPLKQVFEWCTDFQEDDFERVTKEGRKMKLIEKTSKHVRFIVDWDENGKHYKENVIVQFYPPDRWRMESKGNMWDSKGEYVLKPEGENTRITVTVDEVDKAGRNLTQEGMSRWLSNLWDTILQSFEEDRKSSAKS